MTGKSGKDHQWRVFLNLKREKKRGKQKKKKEGTARGKEEEKTVGRIIKEEGGGKKEIGRGANGKGGGRWLGRCFFSALL